MIALIVNPAAGHGLALETAGRLETVLQAKGLPYRLLRSAAPGDAARLAREAAADSAVHDVWSVGGDGTAFEVACGLAGSATPMGIIAAGTGNDYVKTMQIPADPLAAVDFILSHPARPADIGLLNRGHFLNVCGTGFDVTVLDYAQKAKAHHRGLTPYLIGVVKAIRTYRPTRVELEVDGVRETRELLICSIANGRYIGGGIPICPGADPGDGRLELVLVSHLPRWKQPFYLPGLLLGKILTWKITEHRYCRQVRILNRGLRYNVDGEILSMDEPSFGIQAGGLMLHW